MVDLKDRFDPLWHAARVSYEDLYRRHRRAVMGVKELRKQIYRFSVAVLEMDEHYHNELVDMVNGGGKSVSEWMDDHFEIIEAMGEDRRVIFEAIKKGCTENQYIKRGSLIIGDKRLKTQPVTVKNDGVIPKALPEPKSLEEKVEYLRTEFADACKINEGLRKERKHHKEEIVRLTKAFGVAEARIDILEKAIKRLKKALDSVVVVA